MALLVCEYVTIHLMRGHNVTGFVVLYIKLYVLNCIHVIIKKIMIPLFLVILSLFMLYRIMILLYIRVIVSLFMLYTLCAVSLLVYYSD